MLLDTSSINCSPYAYLVYESMHPLSLLMVIISMLYHWRYWSIATLTGYASWPSSSWSYICWWLTIITVPSEWILERIWYATESCCMSQKGMVKCSFIWEVSSAAILQGWPCSSLLIAYTRCNCVLLGRLPSLSNNAFDTQFPMPDCQQPGQLAADDPTSPYLCIFCVSHLLAKVYLVHWKLLLVHAAHWPNTGGCALCETHGFWNCQCTWSSPK